jgi:hypothetical protein
VQCARLLTAWYCARDIKLAERCIACIACMHQAGRHSFGAARDEVLVMLVWPCVFFGILAEDAADGGRPKQDYEDKPDNSGRLLSAPMLVL